MAKPKTKRKPSAYNLHTGREMRKGKTMAQAARSWKGGTTRATPARRSKPTQRRRQMAGRKKPTRRARAKSFMEKPEGAILTGALYAAIGAPLANAAAARAGIPYADDIANGVGGFLALTKSKNRYIKALGAGALVYEGMKIGTIIGNKLIAPQLANLNTTSKPSGTRGELFS